jgi:hypothetical protein
MLRLVRIASASAALSSCAHASGKLDLLTSLTGDWEIVNEQAPDTSQSCDKAQRFAVSKNKREILLTEDWTTFSELYRVVWVEDTRILTIIEGEDRRNDKGDPILGVYPLAIRNRMSYIMGHEHKAFYYSPVLQAVS